MEIEDRIIQGFLRGLQDMGVQAFQRSQRLVPVDTGNLKRSGSVRLTPDGVEIRYSAPYAMNVELGHLRRNTTVNAHWRPPTRIPNGRMVNRSSSQVHIPRFSFTQSARRPKYFVRQSINESMSSLSRIVGARVSRI